MIVEIYKFIKILPRRDRKRIFGIQFAIVIISLFEVFSALLVAGVVGLMVGDSSFLSPEFKGFLENLFGENMLVPIALVILVLGSALSVWLTHRINVTSFDIGKNISVSLLDYFQNIPYKEHLKNNSSDYINMILAECNRLSAGVLSPALQMMARIVLVVFSFSLMLFVDYQITLAVLLIFISAYLLIFYLSRGTLDSNSENLTYSNANRLKSLNEIFKGIMIVILSGNQKVLTAKYDEVSTIGAKALASNSTLSSAPRYVVEVLVYLILFGLVVFYSNSDKVSVDGLFPLMSLVGVLALKVLPSLQQVYNFIATIKGNFSVVPILAPPLIAALSEKSISHSVKALRFDDSISLDSVSYIYDGSADFSVHDISLTINKFDVVAFVGESGSGKTTLTNILAGLLEPDGTLLVDKYDVSNELQRWRRNISYVPQELFLIDGTIAENIVFGDTSYHIDNERLWSAIKLSGLEPLVKKLPLGVDSEVGEGGSKLSGGQRQRLTIARALYSDAEVIIFDEATSALDNSTQSIILETIEGLVGLKTIIILAHRVEAVRQAKKIYMMDKGRIVDSGSFTDLSKNHKFY